MEQLTLEQLGIISNELMHIIDIMHTIIYFLLALIILGMSIFLTNLIKGKV